jgi:O-antigen/teichoic acid export membrane protein
MSLLKNSTIVMVGVIVSNMLAYVFHFIAGRTLGPDDYGEFGALMALFTLLTLPSGAIGFAVTKDTARLSSVGNYEKLSLLRKKIKIDVFIFSAIILILISVFSQFIASFLNIYESHLIIVVGFTLVFSLMLTINLAILQGLKKFKVLSWNSILEAGSRLFFLGIFLFLGYRVSGVLLAYGLAYLTAYLVSIPNIRESKIGYSILEEVDTKPIYRFGLKVLIVNIVIQSMINIPSLFIKHYYSSEFTGYWTAALNIARISLFSAGAISVVMFPEISMEKDEFSKSRIFRRALLLVLLTSIVITLVLFILPRFIIECLYGAEYFGAASMLGWMGIAMIIVGIMQLYFNYLLAKLP